jgi:predicted nucleic acid-binding protein
VASLIDTSILVYRRDPRDPAKQRMAHDVLREGIAADSLVLPHQAIVEFVSAVTRPRRELGNESLMSLRQAVFEARSMMLEMPVIYPNDAVVATALHGVRSFGMSWFDAHLWAHAEANAHPEILSENFEHGRYYGNVRVRNPFLKGANELPPMYAT